MNSADEKSIGDSSDQDWRKILNDVGKEMMEEVSDDVSDLKPKIEPRYGIFKCKKCYCLCKDKKQFENHMKLHEKHENRKSVDKESMIENNTDNGDLLGKNRENDLNNIPINMVAVENLNLVQPTSCFVWSKNIR